MAITTEYIKYPIIQADTKADLEIEEYFSKTQNRKTKKVLSVLKVYDYKEESKRLIRELNEMVAQWK
jgi:O-acetyl-ADP-ribose deacetylase (regulator of RNase III)